MGTNGSVRASPAISIASTIRSERPCLSHEEVTEISEMVSYGIISSPAVVIDERDVHAGGIPTKAEVQRWVLALQA
jgi:hypothetical protein